MTMNIQNSKAPSNLGLYIHIPFCRRKCLYCDFCSFSAQKPNTVSEYVSALCQELTERAEACKNHTVDTVYFGGGTPTLLTAAQFSDIFSVLRENYNIAEDAEITVECNPLTHIEDRKAYFSSLLSLGANRLSIGVQSANDDELKLIGRGHTLADAERTYFDAREAGFENISLDLMFALPSQTIESLQVSIERLISLSPEHVSIYSLQLEEGTPLYKMQSKYDLPGDDLAADMYELIVKRMAESGYIHYEISNFAKDGFYSRHNSKYWSLDEYIGAGLAAHSDFLGVRQENTHELSDYLSGKRTISEQRIGSHEREEEYIMLGLRTKRGISADEFSARFGKNLFEIYGKKIENLKKSDYILIKDGKISLTEQGFEVSNAILSEILDLNY